VNHFFSIFLFPIAIFRETAYNPFRDFLVYDLPFLGEFGISLLLIHHFCRFVGLFFVDLLGF
jgi:hypothetical protein